MCSFLSHLGVCNGQGVHPDPPASPLVFDCMIEQDPEDVVDHLRYFLFLRVLGVDVSQGKHPVLPHRTLQETAGTKHIHSMSITLYLSFYDEICLVKIMHLFLPPVFTAVTEEFYHIGKKESPDFHQFRARRGVLQESGHHL